MDDRFDEMVKAFEAAGEAHMLLPDEDFDAWAREALATLLRSVAAEARKEAFGVAYLACRKARKDVTAPSARTMAEHLADHFMVLSQCALAGRKEGA